MMIRSLLHRRTNAALVAVAMFGLCTIAQIARAADDRLQGLIEPITASKPYRIGVTVVHLNDDFYKGIVYGIEDEAKRSGVEVVQVSVTSLCRASDRGRT